MKISKKSWHYRFLVFCFAPIPKSLCTYFWVFVISIFTLPIMIGVRYVLWFASRMQDKTYEKKEPGLFRSWAKARKEQVCPIIEFVDD